MLENLWLTKTVRLFSFLLMSNPIGLQISIVPDFVVGFHLHMIKLSLVFKFESADSKRLSISDSVLISEAPNWNGSCWKFLTWSLILSLSGICAAKSISLWATQSFYRSVGETLVLFIVSFTISLLCRQPEEHLTINSDIVIGSKLSGQLHSQTNWFWKQ